jgi:hypothetical protein
VETCVQRYDVTTWFCKSNAWDCVACSFLVCCASVLVCLCACSGVRFFKNSFQLILRYAMHGAAKHEAMTGDKRSKDAFFDGFMNKTIKLTTKKKLLEAYGTAFVCQDGNCKVCNSYHDGEPLKCRTCHGQVRPKEPSQQEVCQFHKSFQCLEQAGWDQDGKVICCYSCDEFFLSFVKSIVFLAKGTGQVYDRRRI